MPCPSRASIPPIFAKAEKKGRTRAEVDEIFRWLTGHSQPSLEAEFAKKTSFEDFFAHAPKMNPSRFLIVEAADIAGAAILFQDHPHITIFPGDGIDVMPVVTGPPEDQPP